MQVLPSFQQRLLKHVLKFKQCSHGGRPCALGGLRSVEIYSGVAVSPGHVANKDQEKQGDILPYVAKNVEVLVEQECTCCMQILMKFVI